MQSRGPLLDYECRPLIYHYVSPLFKRGSSVVSAKDIALKAFCHLSFWQSIREIEVSTKVSVCRTWDRQPSGSSVGTGWKVSRKIPKAPSFPPMAGWNPNLVDRCFVEISVSPTIDTEIKAKRNNTISKLATFRITKTKAKVKFGWSIYVDMNAKDHLSN